MPDQPAAPLLERQIVYHQTGAFAGMASWTAVSLAHRLQPQIFPATQLSARALNHAFWSAGMRFMAFDLCRDAIRSRTEKYVTLRGAVSGCVGGLAETLQNAFISAIKDRNTSSLAPRTLGPALLNHGSTLFLCFGSYTFLSSTVSPSQPPPVPLCFFLGGLAGAFGVPVVHAIRTRSLQGISKVSATGFVRVGTVIGCQIITSARILEYLEGRGLVQYEDT